MTDVNCPQRTATPRWVTWGSRFALLALAAWMGLASTCAWGQSLWEVSPYRIHVWIDLKSDPRMPAAWTKHLAHHVSSLAKARVGAAWQVTANLKTDKLTQLLVVDQPTHDTLQADWAMLQERDKLMLVSVERQGQGYRLAAREFDVLTRHWSSTRQHDQVRSDQVAVHIVQLICEVFVPLVRIERIQDDQVTAAIRAGALKRPSNSMRAWQLPTQVNVGDLLVPVIRRADRSGNVGPKGVSPIEWTVLNVTSRKNSRVQCDWQSGYRQPFRTRRSARVEQLARVVKPHASGSTLKLVNRNRPEEPLVGYEVYSRPTEDDEPTFVGRTDWQGELFIPRDDERAVHVLYIRSGLQLLAKLPIIPGDQLIHVARLRNDDVRLEAEGFLQGVQDSLVDLVARREVLASRIRKHLAADELDEAEQLLRELRSLDTQEDFARRVQQRKQSLTTVDADVQQQIDRLFAQTRTLLGQYLSQDQVQELDRAIRDARARP